MAHSGTCGSCGEPIEDGTAPGLCAKCLAAGSAPLPDGQTIAVDASAVVEPGPLIPYFGDYELLDEIARGGMGVVYRARQISLNRPVALKMILTGDFAGEAEIARFYREAESVAKLSHPNIVPIYEIGVHGARHYFSMKLVEGGSLSARIKALSADRKASVQLIGKVARAVHYAHQHGIIHRDLKPANILLDNEDEPHVTDFGLAKGIKGDSDLTLSGVIVGTPHYMAPEQAAGRGNQVTTAADVYSLGAILYHLLVGSPPFEGATVLEVLRKAVDEEPRPPSSVGKAIDKDLETICLKCLEKDPARRYGSAEELARELDRWARHEPIQARPTGWLERAEKWARRKPVVAALSAMLLTSVILGVLGLAWQLGLTRKAQAEAEARALAESAANTQAQKERARAEGMLASAQANRGATLLEESPEGLLYLVEAARNSPGNSAARREFAFLWSSWFANLPARLAAVTDLTEGESARLLPDRSAFLLAHQDGRVRICDFLTHETLGEFKSDLKIAGFLESADANHVRVVGEGGVSEIWDLAKRERLRANVPPEPLRDWSMRFLTSSPDGKLVARPGQEGVNLVDPFRDDKVLFTFPGQVQDLKFSLNSRILLMRGRAPVADGTLGDWKLFGFDTTTGQPAFQALPISTWGWTWYGTTPRGDLYIGAEDRLQLMKPPDWRPGPEMIHPSRMLRLDFSRDGKFLAVAHRAGRIQLWNVDQARAMGLPLILKEPGGVQFNGDASAILTVSSPGFPMPPEAADSRTDARPSYREGTLCSWRWRPASDLTATRLWTNALLGTLDARGEFVALPQTNGVDLVDLDSGESRGKIVSGLGGIGFCEFSFDREMMVSVFQKDKARTLEIWNLRDFSRPVARAEDLPEIPRAFAFARDNKRVAIMDPVGKISIRSTETGALVGEPFGPKEMEMQWQEVEFSPDGERLRTRGSFGQWFWDTTTHSNVLQGVVKAISENWERLALLEEAGALILMDGITNEKKAAIKYQAGIASAAFSQGGALIATAGRDGDVELWNGSTGERLTPPNRMSFQLAGLEGMIQSLTFSADAAFLLVQAKTRARLFHLSTGAVCGPDYVFPSTFQAIRFSKSGRRLFLPGFNHARVWDLPPVPASIREMELRTWTALGVRLNPLGLVESISAGEWRALKDELAAYD